MKTFEEYEENEPILIPWRTGTLVTACCCCGLVHQHHYHVDGDTLVVQIVRDNEFTEKHRKEVGLSIHLEDENVR